MTAAPDAQHALFIADTATVTGEVTLEEGTSVWFGAVIRGDRDRITIGKDSNIQDNATLHTSPGFPLVVGSAVSVGHGAILHGCRVADRVLIGMGAILLNGSEIGEDSLIGAGALVTQGTRVPPNSLVLGVPGRVVRSTTPEEQENIRRNARDYRALAGRYRHGP